MSRKRLRARGGNAVISALTLTTLLGFGALTVDIGHARVARAQLMAACDAGALGGAAYLDGDISGVDDATAMAVEIAEKHKVDYQTVEINDSSSNDSSSGDEVIVGVYNPDNGDFTPYVDTSTDGNDNNTDTDTNSVRVIKTQSNVSVILALASFGRSTLAAGSSTIGYMPIPEPAGATYCMLPLAIPDCVLQKYFDESDEAYYEINFHDLKLQPAGDDNIGWANAPEGASASIVTERLQGNCADSEARVGDPIYLMNGNATTALQEVETQIEAGGKGTWDNSLWGAIPNQASNSSVAPEAYGNLVQGPLAIFHSSDNYCDADGGGWNNRDTNTIVGFAWGAIYDVVVGGASTGNLKVRLEVTKDYTFGSDSVPEDFNYGSSTYDPDDYSSTYQPPPRMTN